VVPPANDDCFDVAGQFTQYAGTGIIAEIRGPCDPEFPKIPDILK